MSNKSKPHIALLPGLDGTGHLFDPIVPYLQDHFEIHVVRYTSEDNFEDYVQSAAEQLPQNHPVSLVGESFSGPIAIALLARKAFDFRASVLSATYCRSPMPLLTQFSNFIPEFLFASNPISRSLMDWMVSGSNSSPELRQKTHDLLCTVSSRTLQRRVSIVNDVDVSSELRTIELPLLYIQATRDTVVLNGSAEAMVNNAQNLRLEKVDGYHMIMQTEPETCARLIIDHVFNSGTVSGQSDVELITS